MLSGQCEVRRPRFHRGSLPHSAGRKRPGCHAVSPRHRGRRGSWDASCPQFGDTLASDLVEAAILAAADSPSTPE